MKVYDGSSTEGGTTETPERLKVGIAEYEVTTNGAELTTSGLGSCVGIALYDTKTAISGLVHIMLPVAEEMRDGKPAKFADTGVELLISEMEGAGADTATIEAKIAGGSDMLDFSESDKSIGDRNAEQVRKTLDSYDIPVVAADVGGDYGRSLKFESATGELVVKSANRDTQRL